MLGLCLDQALFARYGEHVLAGACVSGVRDQVGGGRLDIPSCASGSLSVIVHVVVKGVGSFIERAGEEVAM